MRTYSQPESGLSRKLRLIGLLVCAISIALLAWRVTSALSSRAPVAIMSSESAAVLNVIEPLFGEDNVRVSIAEDNGLKSVVILLNAKTFSGEASRIETLKALVSETAGLNFQTGDRLRIEQTPFYAGSIGEQNVVVFLEWLGLIVLAGLGVTTAMLRPQQSRLEPSAKQEIFETIAEPENEQTPVFSLPMTESASEAADIARQNPKQAAQIVRSWLQGREDAA